MTRIEKIYFVEYKNICRDTELIFNKQSKVSDIVVFIGKNGSGKSSILHAIYGCCEGSVVSDFWFDTAIDPNGGKPEYWYEYSKPEVFKKYNKNPQVRQRRVYRKDKVKKDTKLPDYWESVRPTPDINMNWSEKECQEANNTARWPKFALKAKYIDFRHNITAFDSAIYGSNLLGETARNTDIKYRIIKSSKHLKDKKPYHKRDIYKICVLEQGVIKRINNILGKNYSAITIIYHNYFEAKYVPNMNKVTILIEQDGLGYSDAYAGSGESTVIQLVHQVTQLNEPTIIILDEPESSLHISAQSKLVEFLKQELQHHKHQIFISTHSPYIVDSKEISCDLVFKCSTQNDGKISVRKIENKEHAFTEVSGQSRYMGDIFVEDKNTKIVLDTILQHLKLEKNIYVSYLNGFSSFIHKAFDDSSRSICIGDGDKFKPCNDVYLDNINTIIDEYKRLSGAQKLAFNTKRKNPEEEKKLYLQAIEYFKNNVIYHPFENIEHFLLELTDFASFKPDKKLAFKEYLITQFTDSYDSTNSDSEIKRLTHTGKSKNAYVQMKEFISSVVTRFNNLG